MIDESQTITEQAAEAAPDQDATAAPEAVVEQSTQQPEVTEPKTFTQEELDAIVAKRLAREERKWKREQPQPEPVAYEPADDDETDPRVIAERIVEQREAQKQQKIVLEQYQEREEEALERYDDFAQVAYNPKLRVTDMMAQTITASEIGPDVLYHLGQNPKEADRIAGLPPFLQAKEIGRIEAKISADPPTKKTTSAPAPIAPVVARTSGSSVYDTTDPRSTKSMTTSEWIEADRLRRFKEAQARK